MPPNGKAWPEPRISALKRVAHHHRHRRLVRHRRLLRPRAEGRRLARLRHRAQARRHRGARSRRHRGLLSRLYRPEVDRNAWSPPCWSAPAARSTRCSTMAAMPSPARSRTCRSTRCAQQFEANCLRLARPDAAHRAGHARPGPWPHRPLLVDPRPDAGEMARRLCRLQACAGRADAVPARRTAGLRHPCLADRARPDRIEDRLQRAGLVPEEHRPRGLGPPRGLPGAARAAARRRHRSRGSSSKPDAVHAVLRHALLSPRHGRTML